VTPARAGEPATGSRSLTRDGVAQLTESVLPWRIAWRATEEGALYLGISEAFELRAETGHDGPLVVFADGSPIIDERPRVDAITIDVRAMAAVYETAATSRTEPAGTDAAGTDPAPAEIDDSTIDALTLQLEQAR
jgi:hypothetical protein